MRLALTALLLLATACHREPPPPGFIFSGKIDNVIKHPDMVEVMRIGRPIRRRVGPDVVKALQDVLTSTHTYDDADDRACTFRPEYILLFHDRQRIVEVAVSFYCRGIQARPNELVGDKPVSRRFGRTEGARRLHLLLTQIAPLQ